MGKKANLWLIISCVVVALGSLALGTKFVRAYQKSAQREQAIPTAEGVYIRSSDRIGGPQHYTQLKPGEGTIAIHASMAWLLVNLPDSRSRRVIILRLDPSGIKELVCTITRSEEKSTDYFIQQPIEKGLRYSVTVDGKRYGVIENVGQVPLE